CAAHPPGAAACQGPGAHADRDGQQCGGREQETAFDEVGAPGLVSLVLVVIGAREGERSVLHGVDGLRAGSSAPTQKKTRAGRGSTARVSDGSEMASDARLAVATTGTRFLHWSSCSKLSLRVFRLARSPFEANSPVRSRPHQN